MGGLDENSDQTEGNYPRVNDLNMKERKIRIIDQFIKSLRQMLIELDENETRAHTEKDS